MNETLVLMLWLISVWGCAERASPTSVEKWHALMNQLIELIHLAESTAKSAFGQIIRGPPSFKCNSTQERFTPASGCTVYIQDTGSLVAPNVFNKTNR